MADRPQSGRSPGAPLRLVLEELAWASPVADASGARALVARRVRRRRRSRRAALAIAVAVVLAGVSTAAVTLSGHARATRVTVTQAAPRPPGLSTQLVVWRQGHLEIIDADDGRVARTVPNPAHFDAPTGPIAVAPSGRTVYLVQAGGHGSLGPTNDYCPFGHLEAVDLRTGAASTVTDTGTGPALSPDGTHLAWFGSGSHCGYATVAVRDLSTGRIRTWTLLPRIKVERLVGSLSWAPDGRSLILSGIDASPGVETLDTTRPPSPGNPRPIRIASGAGGVDDAVEQRDGDIVGIQSVCPDSNICPSGGATFLSRVVEIDPRTHGLTSLNAWRTLDLDNLIVDPSGQRQAASEGSALYDLTIDRLDTRLIATGVTVAAWLPAPPAGPTENDGTVIGSIHACFGIPPRPPRKAGFVGGTVLAVRGSTHTTPSGRSYRLVLPTDIVAAQTVGAGGTYRFDLPAGPYVLELSRYATGGGAGASVSVDLKVGGTIRADIPNDCI